MLPEFFPEWFNQLGLMAWPLAACSIIAIAIYFERMVFAVKSSMQKKATYERLAAKLNEYKNQPKSLRDEVVGVMLNQLQRPYYSGIKPLRIIGTISPMLGLLGTILGIIEAFKVIAMQTGAVSPSMIADGLWEAMLTTAVGLFIALPTLLMAHFFRHLSDKQLGEFCINLNELSIALEVEKNSKKASGKPEAVAA